MSDSIYRKLRFNPPALKIVDNPKRVSFKMVSCMCDNRSTITFLKKGDFWSVWAVLPSGMGNSMSNYQFGLRKPMQPTTDDFRWWALDGEWNKILEYINSGTEAIESVRSY